MNIGYRWLARINMLGASEINRICALSALEMNLPVVLGIDTYPDVWEGNVPGDEATLHVVRRCMHHGSTSYLELLTSIGVDKSTLQQFLEEVQNATQSCT